MANLDLFGWAFKRKKPDVQDQPQVSFTPKEIDDGALVISAAAAYGTYVDLDGTVRTEAELINRYREMSMHAEVDAAADEITNEAITTEEEEVVKINLDNLQKPNDAKTIKDAIEECWEDVLKLLDFRNNSYKLFKRWYIDGRLYFHVIIDPDDTKAGIKELRYVDPRKIRKIREVIKKNVKGGDVTTGDAITSGTKNEYYIYNEKGFNTGSGRPVGPSTTGLKIAADAILYMTSGLTDVNGTMVLSYLHKAIKPLNQLRTLEDANVIYCLVADTRILTEFGYKYIKDITTQDRIYSYNKGKLELTRVKKQWMSGTKPVFKIKSKHFSLTGTDTHPILVLNQEGRIQYVNIGDLRIGKHSLIIPKKEDKGIDIKIPIPERTTVIGLKNFEIWSNLNIKDKEETIHELEQRYHLGGKRIRNFLYGMQCIEKKAAISILNEFNLLEKADLTEKYEGWSKNEINVPEIVDEDFARLFGFMIGDGSVRQYDLCFAESPDEKQNLYYASLLERYFGNCRKYDSETRKYVNYSTSNTLGAELFYQMGWISGSKHKRIPSWVFQAKNNIKKAFIEGLADADGHIQHHKSGKWYCEFELCNKQLIEDIKEIWSSLNLSSGHIRHRVRKAEYRKFGNEMRHMKETESWAIFISDCLLKETEKLLSVECAGVENVYDIEVEHEAHNFIANDVAVHNCLSRAPERRVWYIDVGNLPKMKAEQYVRDIMVKHKNRLIYDSASGEVRDDRKFMTMLEDYWLPRREGGKGTEVTTLPAGQNLGEMANVEYFLRKLYGSLHVPINRLNPDDVYIMGQDLSAGISRDEIKFGKFIGRLRNDFSKLFIKCLGKQMVLKQLITIEDFEKISTDFRFDFSRDNYFMEQKENQVTLQRVDVVHQMMDLIGRYYSNEWVAKNVLKQSEEDIEEMRQQITEEMNDPIWNPPLPEDDENANGDDGDGDKEDQEVQPDPQSQNYLQQAKDTYNTLSTSSKKGGNTPDYRKASKAISKNG